MTFGGYACMGFVMVNGVRYRAFVVRKKPMNSLNWMDLGNIKSRTHMAKIRDGSDHEAFFVLVIAIHDCFVG